VKRNGEKVNMGHKQSVMGLLILGCLILTGCPAGKQSGAVESQKILTRLELNVFEKVNDYRRQHGLNSLTVEERIVKQARVHSRNMAENKVGFSHAGFRERVRNTGINYRAAAENIAFNQGTSDPAATAVAEWIRSEGHRENIEGAFTQTGIGVIRNNNGGCYFTQIFILTKN
jgi:uncharacterized protein YkwD